MNGLFQHIHGSHQSHDADHGHSHGDAHEESHHPSHGSKLMQFLGIAQWVAHNEDWMSDYRSSKLIPASPHILIATVVVLLVGIALWYTMPQIGLFAVILIGAAAVHLALLVIGGLSVTLFVRHQRTQAQQMMLNSVQWTGAEQVLDVGCGTGMMLNTCARKLTTGKAIGVDLWQQVVAGSPSTLMANARAEGVVDKIEYQEMDARHLTFDEAKFNVVVSSFALHHIGSQRKDREQAIMEMIRVLKPGGTLSLIDVAPMITIAEDVITQAGLQGIRGESNGFFRFVTARKL